MADPIDTRSNDTKLKQIKKDISDNSATIAASIVTIEAGAFVNGANNVKDSAAWIALKAAITATQAV